MLSTSDKLRRSLEKVHTRSNLVEPKEHVHPGGTGSEQAQMSCGSPSAYMRVVARTTHSCCGHLRHTSQPDQVLLIAILTSSSKDAKAPHSCKGTALLEAHSVLPMWCLMPYAHQVAPLFPPYSAGQAPAGCTHDLARLSQSRLESSATTVSMVMVTSCNQWLLNQWMSTTP
jgi:hypothetical protein